MNNKYNLLHIRVMASGGTSLARLLSAKSTSASSIPTETGSPIKLMTLTVKTTMISGTAKRRLIESIRRAQITMVISYLVKTGTIGEITREERGLLLQKVEGNQDQFSAKVPEAPADTQI
jgi:hypothetical protein